MPIYADELLTDDHRLDQTFQHDAQDLADRIRRCPAVISCNGEIQ
jgi:hypothetical protein